jgi:signal transduction histidine kinase
VGLGLSLAKAYAESINGTIQVESTLNQGSRFALRFMR